MSRVTWELSSPLYKNRVCQAGMWSLDGVKEPLTKEQAEKIVSSGAVKLKRGDPIVILRWGDEVFLTEPSSGSTLLSALKTIDKGLSKKLHKDISEGVYLIIGKHARSAMRLDLAKRFEAGSLTARDLLGDTTGFYASFNKKDGIWHYGVDS